MRTDEVAVVVSQVPCGLICLEAEGSGAVLRLVGEIDYGVVVDFDASHPTAAYVDYIDAGAVTFMSAAGVGLMLRYAEASRDEDHRLMLRRSSRIVDYVLGLLSLSDTFAKPATTTPDTEPSKWGNVTVEAEVAKPDLR